ncbi:pseudouridine synthase [Rhizoclosmatium globosum]|uniref:Pseudouridine synthase n=1 Tax=Rhizoclosmatium globosum TaxID=329046 RepID=A0A1Y2CVN7_9FUNG|nr:pseudouridine synthase [Rhizoclosmatium globosum]|eukprot:ORY51088.1 pseudouridine synthase [Rhizoclosmatium globosum]
MVSIAILFGYNGSNFAGLERAKGDKSIESILLSALATLTGKSAGTDSVTMINISRAATTEEGEHAARQVLSVEIVDENIKVPSVDAMNAILPASIKVFKIVNPTGEGFSARRSCETRTYEYLIPSYAFLAPQAEAGYDYVHETVSKEDLDNMYPDADPEVDRSGEGSLFTTLKRLGRSRSRNGRSASRGRSAGRNSVILDSNPTTPTTERPSFFSSLRRKSLQRTDQESIDQLIPTTDSIVESVNQDASPQFFDPIPLPSRNVDQLRNYRMTEEQLDMIRTIVAIYRGTHNWHNYVPGADPDDQRCFMRIINIESGSPEIHSGMEWIRIKIQSKALARFQFRRMMALLILVIRTNTPRSLIANSFGVGKIEIPDAPASGLIFHQPGYALYNQNVAPEFAINFDDEKSKVEGFRKTEVHERVFLEEREELHFEQWLKEIDRHSFLYKYYLNSRGLIGVQNAFIRQGAVEENMYNIR